MQEEIRFEIEEFEYSHKTNDWYWAVGIITTAIAIASVIFENILFAILIIIASFTLVMQSAKKPTLLKVLINARGITINNKFYPFNNLESFWVDKNGETDTLLIKSKKITMPYIVVPLHEEDSGFIENFLTNFLNEEELHEPLAQKIMERLGF